MFKLSLLLICVPNRHKDRKWFSNTNLFYPIKIYTWEILCLVHIFSFTIEFIFSCFINRWKSFYPDSILTKSFKQNSSLKLPFLHLFKSHHIDPPNPAGENRCFFYFILLISKATKLKHFSWFSCFTLSSLFHSGKIDFCFHIWR